MIFENYHHTLKPGLRSQFLQVSLVPYKVFVLPTGSFGGRFRFSPLNGLFSSLSVIFANYRHTRNPRLCDQFLQVTLVPRKVFMPPTGSFGGWFEFSPFNGLFLSLSVILANYRYTLKSGDPGLRDQFLQVTLVPCELFVPPTGSFGGWFGFSPFNGLFLSH